MSKYLQVVSGTKRCLGMRGDHAGYLRTSRCEISFRQAAAIAAEGVGSGISMLGGVRPAATLLHGVEVEAEQV